jgi:anaerobic carbon-monoxide dehydrogenase iron sulfur subunit
MTEKRYTLVPQKCTGCRTCKVACAAIKGEKGVLGRSRIQIVDFDENTHVQLNCLQCVNAACVQACPSAALYRDEASRAVALNEARCIGCGLCETVCPFGHIFFDKTIRLPLKCDLCGGDPACAKFCPHQAILFK